MTEALGLLFIYGLFFVVLHMQDRRIDQLNARLDSFIKYMLEKKDDSGNKSG